MTETTITAGPTAGSQETLRTVLRLDAAASGLLGVVAAAGAAALDAPIGMPAPALLAVGLFLVVYALGLVVLAAPATIPRAGVWTVVVGNAGWVLASVAAAAGAFWELTVLGTVVVLAQAVAVALLALLQYAGLRRT